MIIEIKNGISPTIHVEATGLPDAYYQLVHNCLKHGAEKWRDYDGPTQTISICSLTDIRRPFLEPVLHPDFPTKEKHLEEYKKQWAREYDWKKQGFEYSYMDRLINYPAVGSASDTDDYYQKTDEKYIEDNLIDQLQLISDRIQDRINKGGPCLVSNRDQMLTWVTDRDLSVKADQPCCRGIQLFLLSYPTAEKLGKLVAHVWWRSRDLFAAWNSNYAGLLDMLKRELLDTHRLELVALRDYCDDLHIYFNDIPAAKLVKPWAVNPQLRRF